ncbi:type 1 glutamine amidotransferase [Knoellia sp. p5-6-4]|uniref:type 1 glutamine amidotransferase n=1 Tax=unclassified Knoellia TaxID=2618719 RepID=UPI0023D9FCE5|nr:type 1 glutamine amidotransferase [Knoellia sp. p5-6-4]MDF2144901.1 type 1 glutamine amidotransferase [Knoellia sp. p5-6-4]
MRPRVVAVRNSPGSPLARLADWFGEDGLDVTEVDGDDLHANDLDGAHGLVLLGGGYLPDDDATAPWLPRERALAAWALAHGTPLLGICLGAQLLAHVAGGRVVRDHGVPERGSCRVALTPDAVSDPLFGGLPAEFPAIQNHRDQVVDLPRGAVLLATSEVCRVQAFRVGAAAWGVQFHPEAAASRLDSWDDAALADDGIDPDELRRAAEVAEPRSAEAARELARRFAEQIHRSSATAPLRS